MVESIKLTNIQKLNLLVMCKKLFPEYNIQFIHNNFLHLTKDKKYTEIHWFEFCSIHLFEKIFVKPYGYESIKDYINMNGCVTIKNDYLDYLYEEFLKLKL